MTTYYLKDAQHGYSRIMQENNSDAYADCDTGVDSFDPTNKFCLEIQIQAYQVAGACNKDINSCGVRLEVRKDSGSWLTLAASDLSGYACSGISDEGSQGSSHCGDPSAAECASGYETGVQTTDGVTSKAITKEYYTSIVIGIDPSGGSNGSTYEFRLYDTTNSAAIPFASGDACAAYITVVTSGTTYYQSVGAYAMSIAGSLATIATWARAMGGYAMSIAGTLATIATWARAMGGHAMSIAGALVTVATWYRAMGGYAMSLGGQGVSAVKLAVQAVGAYAMTIVGALATVYTAGQATGGHAMTITGTLTTVATWARAMGGYAMSITGILTKKMFETVGEYAMTIAGGVSAVKLAVQAVGGYAMTIVGSLSKVTTWVRAVGGYSMTITGVLSRVATFYSAVGGFALTIVGALGTLKIPFVPGGIEKIKKWLLTKVGG